METIVPAWLDVWSQTSFHSIYECIPAFFVEGITTRGTVDDRKLKSGNTNNQARIRFSSASFSEIASRRQGPRQATAAKTVQAPPQALFPAPLNLAQSDPVRSM